MSRIDQISQSQSNKRSLKDTIVLLSAATAVIAITQTVESQRLPAEARLQDEDFAGDRSPAILHEPSETPVGDQAALYLEQEWAFERARAASPDAEND